MHGSVPVFLNFIQQIISESDDRTIKIKKGKIKPKKREKKYAELDDKIMNTLNEYEVIIGLYHFDF